MLRRPLLVLLLALTCLARAASAADDLLPRPPELEPDVQFWIRVYSEISTSEGYIHDQRDLRIVYETLHFADAAPRVRQQLVDAARERWQAALRHVAAGAEPATSEERRVRELWGAEAGAARLLAAVDDVRFQLGQSDRFRAGLKRAGAWETHIAEALANRGLPAELAALPHVESSFDPEAYSKVGASGLWQFMRSTGRLFMRIDRSVDERLDPFRSTEAAARSCCVQLPRARHLAAGDHRLQPRRRRRAPCPGPGRERRHRAHRARLPQPELRFRLAQLLRVVPRRARHRPRAVQVLRRDRARPENHFREVALPAAASAAALERVLGVEHTTLRALNPALLPAVWRGERSVPRGYRLRLPDSAPAWTSEALAQRLGARPEPAVATVAAATSTSTSTSTAAPAAPAATTPVAPPAATPAAASESASYVVRAGDTLSAIAARTGVNATQLMAFNALRDQDHIYEGQRLRLAAAVETPPAAGDSAARAVEETRADTRAADVAERESGRVEPVSAAQAAAQSPNLLPGATAATTVDVIDYSVAADGSIRIAAAETIGHFADWLGIGATRLRALNGLQGGSPLVIGRRLKLDFRRVPRVQFEQKRRDYHERLQAEYFSSHRIVGTEIYIARRGDSLWSLTKHDAGIPVWLLQQFNPDVDFGDLQPGAQIIVPRVETLADV
ncbi:MAG: LysM peptidoglycan-binding domain-containing protein [Steroidobacteraceae bacterium]